MSRFIHVNTNWAYVYIHLCAYIHVYEYVYIHLCAYIHVYDLYTCIYAHKCMYTYSQAIRTNTPDTYTQIHRIHTHKYTEYLHRNTCIRIFRPYAQIHHVNILNETLFSEKMCFSTLQHTTTHYNTMQHSLWRENVHSDWGATAPCTCKYATPRVLQCVAVCRSVLQMLLYVVLCCSVLQCVAVCCSVLQCVAVCCSVLQCVAALTCVSHATQYTTRTSTENFLHQRNNEPCSFFHTDNIFYHVGDVSIA